MKYIKVKWIHDFENYPILLYSELDNERYELRKVDVFSDGTYGYADENKDTYKATNTALGLLSTPDIDDIAKSNEFEPFEIQKEEFEEIWEKALTYKLNQ